MAEEVTNAATAIPRAIMVGVFVNGSLGFGMLIAILFCMNNIKQALNTDTGYPFIEIFYQATNSVAGACAMTGVVLGIAICTIAGVLAATSRQFWAFARDKGVPGWRVWTQVGYFRVSIDLNPS